VCCIRFKNDQIASSRNQHKNNGFVTNVLPSTFSFTPIAALAGLNSYCDFVGQRTRYPVVVFMLRLSMATGRCCAIAIAVCTGKSLCSRWRDNSEAITAQAFANGDGGLTTYYPSALARLPRFTQNLTT